jgi:wyosine [tRNA(Phe)-imidazoG37] synthetase (radical SAM superfamily)
VDENLKNAWSSHSREYKNHQYAYAVFSRRSGGISLGVNLNLDTLCNFDCIYCQVRRPEEAREQIIDLEQMDYEIRALLHQYQKDQLASHSEFRHIDPNLLVLKDIALSGNGEPTLIPQFKEVCELLAQIKTDFTLLPELVLISNSTLLQSPRVVQGLNILAESQGCLWGKLDAGTEAHYQKIDRSRVTLEQCTLNLIDAIKRIPLKIQTLVCGIENQLPPESEWQAWLERIQRIYHSNPQNFKEIQLCSLARQTTETWCTAAPLNYLESIQNKINKTLDVTVRIY